LDISEFHYMKNFIHQDEVDQGHLCEPYQHYCEKREIELRQKYSKSGDIPFPAHDVSSKDAEMNTTLHGTVNYIEQVIDGKEINNKPSDFPENFDEWYHKKLQEKREIF